MHINDVRNTAEDMLASHTNGMTKIKVKCWLHHSESRTKNNNEPYTYDNYTRGLGKDTYLDHINLNLIDCTDIGGKEHALETVEKWYG